MCIYIVGEMIKKFYNFFFFMVELFIKKWYVGSFFCVRFGCGKWEIYGYKKGFFKSFFVFKIC